MIRDRVCKKSEWLLGNAEMLEKRILKKFLRKYFYGDSKYIFSAPDQTVLLCLPDLWYFLQFKYDQSYLGYRSQIVDIAMKLFGVTEVLGYFLVTQKPRFMR